MNWVAPSFFCCLMLHIIGPVSEYSKMCIHNHPLNKNFQTVNPAWNIQCYSCLYHHSQVPVSIWKHKHQSAFSWNQLWTGSGTSCEPATLVEKGYKKPVVSGADLAFACWNKHWTFQEKMLLCQQHSSSQNSNMCSLIISSHICMSSIS